jgi:hypothetical protein
MERPEIIHRHGLKIKLSRQHSPATLCLFLLFVLAVFAN